MNELAGKIQDSELDGGTVESFVFHTRYYGSQL
jgi:hypothetical protein